MSPAVIVFLLQFHCHPTAAVVQDPHLPGRGAYKDGVVSLRLDADDGVLVHELVHDCQWKKHGKATTSDEWFRREREAKAIENIWRDRE